MSRRAKRLLSIWMLAMLAFAHGSLALAACGMERGQLHEMPAGEAQAGGHDCCDEPMPVTQGKRPLSVIGCVSHCTSDLQAVSLPAVPVLAGASAQIFVRAPIAAARSVPSRVDERPPAAVPFRILLHSFLI